MHVQVSIARRPPSSHKPIARCRPAADHCANDSRFHCGFTSCDTLHISQVWMQPCLRFGALTTCMVKQTLSDRVPRCRICPFAKKRSRPRVAVEPLALSRPHSVCGTTSRLGMEIRCHCLQLRTRSSWSKSVASRARVGMDLCCERSPAIQGATATVICVAPGEPALNRLPDAEARVNQRS